jgi:hypothetical protein
VIPIEVSVRADLDTLGAEMEEKMEALTWDHHQMALEALPTFESEIEDSLEFPYFVLVIAFYYTCDCCLYVFWFYYTCDCCFLLYM